MKSIHLHSEKQVLVYVQAVPVSVPPRAKKFEDIASSDFQLAHASKVALSFASANSNPEITVVGFAPVLREALARGGSRCTSVPLCEDPLQQATFLPNDANEFEKIILGDTPDWVFSGASLAGVLAKNWNVPIVLAETVKRIEESNERALILVQDSGESPEPVDIRKIKNSFDISVNPENVLGSSLLVKLEPRKTEILSGDAREISSAISRRLRRLLPPALEQD